VGPACQCFAESGVNGSRHRSGSHHQSWPPTDTAVPRATGRLSADRPSVPRVRLGALGTDVGPQLTPSLVPSYVARVKWGSRHICAERFTFGSGQRALCRPSGLCREYSGLCQEELALGKAPYSGSEKGRSPEECTTHIPQVRMRMGRPCPGLDPGPCGLMANFRGHGSTQFSWT
jgi:hypothetical protein